ncbi:cation diffusion facilitator family transporter [Cellulosimicrobium marinum]|uniref:cation diffusion facilitator family transporter n=1 Tax=Cellulosimicrobium marinum TaxID=1638992 RepID=UPI001E35AFB7|nr:cation diffusion facilitator family transporter [Cellulosimicrobium marinum]MCB7135100.1 cation diffusion facilitator family transporter [Cellulosimicrobium marinum]
MPERDDPTASAPFPGTSPRVVQGDAHEGGESTLTVVIAFVANALIAVAKSVAATLTGSASMLAEAVHSWADTGNEVFLLVADRRSRRPADPAHPLGYGREAYVWSMFAAIGLFAVGAGVSITHGIQELVHPEPAGSFGVAYAVLGLAFVLEGVSFLQARRQVRAEARRADQETLHHVLATSDPTLRAVFAEDAAALVGLVVAFAGVLAHQLTGSPVPDAIGSIVVGAVLAVVSVVLIDRNRRFLVGEAALPGTRDAVLRAIAAMPVVERVTYLRLEYVGPRSLYLVASVDLVGDEAEVSVARRLDELERAATRSSFVAGAVFTVSTPEEPSLL